MVLNMENLELVIATVGTLMPLLIPMRLFFGEKAYKILSEITILLLLVVCLCNAIIKTDYKKQIELQKEIIDLQHQQLNIYLKVQKLNYKED